MALSNSNSELSPLFFSSAFEDEEDEEGEDEEDEAARFLSKTVFKTSSSSSPSSSEDELLPLVLLSKSLFLFSRSDNCFINNIFSASNLEFFTVSTSSLPLRVVPSDSPRPTPSNEDAYELKLFEVTLFWLYLLGVS